MEEILMCNGCGFQGVINDFCYDDFKNVIFCPACGEEEIMDTETGEEYKPKVRW